MFEIDLGVVSMSWKDLASLGIIVLGIILFLYGSNAYDAVIGWTGVTLILAGIAAQIILRIYDFLMKKGNN